MLKLNYSLIESAGDLTVQWSPFTIPAGFFFVGVGLVVLGLALNVLRHPIAVSFVGEESLGRVKKLLSVCGVLMLGCGSAVMFFAYRKPPLIRWGFSGEGVAVHSLNGDLSFAWKDVTAARLDESGKGLEHASLVLVDREGKEMWLVLQWLISAHRARVIRYSAAHAPAAFKPVLSNEAYVKKLGI